MGSIPHFSTRNDMAARTFALNIHDHAVLEELSFVRREAQLEANLAYEDWGRGPARDRWAVYLAAQDRGDAAQEMLANWARRMTG